MKKFLLGLLLLPFLVVFLFGAEGNAVLFSWDGAGRENVLKFADEGKLPVIESLRKTGAFVEIKITGHATSTGPAHANMLTGFGPEVNLVQSNSSYFSIPAGLTLGERLEKTLGPDNIFTIMVMGKLGYMGAAYGQPYNNAVKALDVWDGDKDKRDATVVAGAGMKYLEQFKEKRFFMFLHFSDPDTKGHGFGEGSSEYEKALVTCDEQAGRVINKLKELGIYGKTAIYITADHGFDKRKNDHKNAPEIFLAATDPSIKKNGIQSDITPTILKYFGLDLTKLEPVLPGIPLN